MEGSGSVCWNFSASQTFSDHLSSQDQFIYKNLPEDFDCGSGCWLVLAMVPHYTQCHRDFVDETPNRGKVLVLVPGHSQDKNPEFLKPGESTAVSATDMKAGTRWGLRGFTATKKGTKKRTHCWRIVLCPMGYLIECLFLWGSVQLGDSFGCWSPTVGKIDMPDMPDMPYAAMVGWFIEWVLYSLYSACLSQQLQLNLDAVWYTFIDLPIVLLYSLMYIIV